MEPQRSPWWSLGQVEARRGTACQADASTASPASLLVLVAACVRDPLADGCPDLAEGDLVITEMRGPQSGSYRQWIEVYNPSDAPIPAAGLRLEFTRERRQTSSPSSSATRP
jgi:hypothetical protein